MKEQHMEIEKAKKNRTSINPLFNRTLITNPPKREKTQVCIHWVLFISIGGERLGGFEWGEREMTKNG